MALLFMDGFGHQATADLAKKWSINNGVVYSASGRGGGGVYLSTTTDNLKKIFASNYTTVIAGIAVYADRGGVTYNVLRFYDAGSTQITLAVTATGAVTIAGQTSSAGDVPPVMWTYLEVKFTISNTVGTVEVRKNGNPTPILSATGIDTQTTANAYINEVAITTGSVGVYVLFDDFYVCDTSGAQNNDFLGDVTIKTVFPTAEGTNSAWTPLSGVDNALMVDETAQDGDTTYNSTSTLNARDTHVIADIATLGGTVYAVAVNATARKEGTSVRGIKTTVKSGATYSLGTEEILSTSYTTKQSLYELDPNTSTAWTETTVNAMEAGVDLST